MEVIWSAVAAAIAVVLLTAFALRLWGRWVGDKATEEERKPGIAGVRAWFSASNVTMGVAIVAFTSYGFDISPFVLAVGIAAVLAAYPVLRMESAAPAPKADDTSVEREKIVSMLEAGKLTPDESAELLQALNESSRIPATQPIKLTSGQRLMLIGAALVALGFFLPWFVFNPGKIANDMMMNIVMKSPLEASGFSITTPEMKTPNVSISGGDIQKGLGWMTLLLAAAAALIPYFATRLDGATMRTVRYLCLGVGAFIVLYLLTQNARFVAIGLIIAITGYILEIVGVVRDSRYSSGNP
jgi:hypothetical protein